MSAGALMCLVFWLLPVAWLAYVVLWGDPWGLEDRGADNPFL